MKFESQVQTWPWITQQEIPSKTVFTHTKCFKYFRPCSRLIRRRNKNTAFPFHFQRNPPRCICEGRRRRWIVRRLKSSPAQLFGHRGPRHTAAVSHASQWSDTNAAQWTTLLNVTQCVLECYLHEPLHPHPPSACLLWHLQESVWRATHLNTTFLSISFIL